MRHWWVAVCYGLWVLGSPAAAQEYDKRIARVLRHTPLIDGHNDWAEALCEREGDGRWTIDLTQGLQDWPVPYSSIA